MIVAIIVLACTRKSCTSTVMLSSPGADADKCADMGLGGDRANWGCDLPKCFAGGGESEWGERTIARRYTRPDACVLEFGGGAGSVSATLGSILIDPTNHVVIQPDEDNDAMFGGLAQLRRNAKKCNLKCQIVGRFLQHGDGVRLRGMVSKPFDTIVADCEGCLVNEYKKNPDLFEHVTQIQVERDDGGKYNILGMRMVEPGKTLGCGGDCDTEVWVR